MILLYDPALCSCSTLLLFDSCSLRREPEESLTTHTPPVRLGLGTNLLTAELLTGVILEVPYNELCAGRKQSMYFQHSVHHPTCCAVALQEFDCLTVVIYGWMCCCGCLPLHVH